MLSASEISNNFVSRVEYEATLSELNKLKEENARLYLYLLNARKALYGRKSEKMDDRQMSMFESGEIEIDETFEPIVEVEVPSHSRRKSSGRKPLPIHLPRERIEYFPEDKVCSSCNKELHRIGEEVTEELEFIPAKLLVKEHVKVKMACPSCKNCIRTAVLPPEVQPIERGRPGISLIVYLIMSKFCDHLPLYRLEKMFLREGIEIPRQRMCDWLLIIADQLKSLHRALLKELLKISYLQADETRIMVQDAEKEDGLRTGFFWAVHAPPSLVYYRYAPSRASEVALDLFAGYEGFVQTDMYAGYNQVFLPSGVLRLACFAHVRRKFLDKGAARNKEANNIMVQISKLYKIESDIKLLDDAQKAETRKEKSLPLLEKLFKDIEVLNSKLLPQHPLREATEYALKQKAELMRYVEDGRFQIDNNSIERQMRPVAIGRKNYLFAGSNAGAEAASIFYSLINSCKLNNINPREYLTEILSRLPTHPTSKISDLLPHKWTPLNKTQTIQ